MRITLGLILLAALLIGGTMDFQEAQYQDDFHCEMVREGSWPDYKNLDCGENDG